MNRRNNPTWCRSLDIENNELVQGISTGEIPSWLNGNLFRIGPGIFEIGTSSLNHLFDGFAVLHKFAISEGRATYNNAVLKSDAYLKSIAANRLMVHQFGTISFPDPCKRLFGRLMSRFEHQDYTDNCLINFCYFGDRLYTMTETPMLREVDPLSLDTLGDKVDLSKYFSVHHSTAHPHVDPDGTVYTMANSAGKNGFFYNILRLPKGEHSIANASIVASFPSRWKMSHSYYHSFGITDNYLIFIELPLSINVFDLATMSLRRKSYCSSLQWNSNERSRILLVDRSTGKFVETIYEADPFFCFHHANAFEKDGHLVVDICYYDDAKVINDLMLKNLRQNRAYSAGKYTRFVLPLQQVIGERVTSKENQNIIKLGGTACKAYWNEKNRIHCAPEHLFNEKIELPRINYDFNGKEYNYAYAVTFCDDLAETYEVIKLDVSSRDVKKWSRPGYSPSEPVYVPLPKASSEDDGVVLFSALDLVRDNKVFLVILNATTFEEIACTEFTTSGRVTKDFHGLFAASSSRVHRY